MEKLRLRSKEGSSKVTGVLVCFGGALLISLYKGKVLLLGRAVVRVGHKDSNGAAGPHHLRVTLLLLGNCISYACWYPIQVRFICSWVFSERRLTPLTFYIFFISTLTIILVLFLCLQFTFEIWLVMTHKYNILGESSRRIPTETLVFSGNLFFRWSANICHRNNHEKGQTCLANRMEYSTTHHRLLSKSFHNVYNFIFSSN